MTHFCFNVDFPREREMSEEFFTALMAKHVRREAEARGYLARGQNLPVDTNFEVLVRFYSIHLRVELPDGEELRLDRLLESSGVCLVR